jgi:eukaryotic-like serine/threonine-protein kinase
MDPSPVAIGQLLAGKYRIERVLGEGGMGVVVEAHDLALERRVAIKFLLPDFIKHAEAKARFTREARAAAKIQSEHVARVIDVSTLETGAPYMVMEFLEGSDLGQTIETTGPLSIEDTALYVIQACEALAEAHAHGIVHRDLKPANLFLAQQAGGSCKIKVLDFGISKVLTATDPGLLGSLTRTSSMMGSPLYMSPEQMKSARDVDHRTDIWALGVILYESLTGTPPFLGGSIPEISAKILLEDPRPIHELVPSIPQALSDLTARALAKMPDQRFENVGDLALALLPFAPMRARGNVERIVRVLTSAGMSQGLSLANVPAGAATGEATLEGLGLALGAPLEPQPDAPKRKQGTLANWGQTHSGKERTPGAPPRRSRRWLGAVAGSVLGVVAAVDLIARLSGTPTVAAGAAAAPVSAAALAASPAPGVSAPAAPPEPAPPAGAVVALPALAEAAASPAPMLSVADLDEAAARAAATAPGSAGAKAAGSTSAASTKKTTRAPTASATPRTAAAVSKPKEKTYSGDFKAKFGSRK